MAVSKRATARSLSLLSDIPSQLRAVRREGLFEASRRGATQPTDRIHLKQAQRARDTGGLSGRALPDAIVE
jgi:hypothetical protein